MNVGRTWHCMRHLRGIAPLQLALRVCCHACTQLSPLELTIETRWPYIGASGKLEES